MDLFTQSAFSSGLAEALMTKQFLNDGVTPQNASLHGCMVILVFKI